MSVIKSFFKLFDRAECFHCVSNKFENGNNRIIVKNTDPRARQPRFKFQFYHSLAKCSGASHLGSLYFDFSSSSLLGCDRFQKFSSAFTFKQN